MRILPYGERAVLAEVDTLEQAVSLSAALETDRAHVRGVLELVPGARSVLVRFEPHAISLMAVERWIAGVEVSGAQPRAGDRVTIPVRYDGDDLEETAQLLGMSPEELVARHSGSSWRAAFVGFAPGFAYLTSPGFRVEVPRRATSRPSVAPGSVGLAGEFSGVYPRDSPGGWQLIGRTEANLWDVNRTPPALLRPGTEVVFEVIGT
ncbi:allophanate hydrolase subunit 1 [Lysobacter korlensis]|uniref:Allophanate hydrolase subunit 1 n=1 Tax=Lysobacter korlensis TaxID=553636 RepID=A0ABV6RV32_9GAMM